MNMNRLLNSTIVLIVTLLGNGCGNENNSDTPTPNLKEFEILLDWQAEPTYLGVYYAKSLGLFSDLGLNVSIIQSWGANQAVSSVATGRYKISTASGGATVLGHNKGAEIVSLGVLYPNIPSVIYGLASEDIETIEDLKGKKIGIYPNSITVNEFDAFLKANTLSRSDFDVVSISGSDVPLLASGQVDAVLNYWEMSPAAIETNNDFKLIRGKRTFTFKLSEHGVGGYGLNIVTSRDVLNSDEGDLVKQVAEAIIEGYRRASQDPQNALELFFNEFPEKDGDYVREGFRRVVELLGENFGLQTVEGWQTTLDIYDQLGLLDVEIEADSLLP